MTTTTPVEDYAPYRRLDQRLTDRELQVAAGAANGLTDREIGRPLGIAADTVKSHLRRGFRKTGTNGRALLVVELLRAGELAWMGGRYVPSRQTARPVEDRTFWLHVEANGTGGHDVRGRAFSLQAARTAAWKLAAGVPA